MARGYRRPATLVVAAAYKAAEANLQERVLPLQRHTAADSQRGTLGDLEITLLDDDRVITSYEMKAKRVTRNDIDQALQKVITRSRKVDNYI